MKRALVSMVAVVFVLGLMAPAFAAEKTLTGKLTCNKCDLKKADKCQNALIVKEGDKEVTYVLEENQVSKDFHKNVCKGAKENVSVTGTVNEEKKTITATEIKS